MCTRDTIRRTLAWLDRNYRGGLGPVVFFNTDLFENKTFENRFLARSGVVLTMRTRLFERFIRIANPIFEPINTDKERYKRHALRLVWNVISAFGDPRTKSAERISARSRASFVRGSIARDRCYSKNNISRRRTWWENERTVFFRRRSRLTQMFPGRVLHPGYGRKRNVGHVTGSVWDS